MSRVYEQVWRQAIRGQCSGLHGCVRSHYLYCSRWADLRHVDDGQTRPRDSVLVLGAGIPPALGPVSDMTGTGRPFEAKVRGSWLQARQSAPSH